MAICPYNGPNAGLDYYGLQPYQPYNNPITTTTVSPSHPSLQSPSSSTTVRSGVFFIPKSYSSSISPTVQVAYQQLVDTYSRNVSEATKGEILKSLNTTFLGLSQYKDVFDLKQLLDVKFAKDVNCKYRYFGKTPNSYGCDLRELVFKRDGTLTPGGRELIDVFSGFSEQYSSQTGGKQLHVLTDIDDTIYPNDMFGIAGLDKSWISHEPYPGIIEFYKEIHSLHNSSGYSTVVSAAPGFIKPKKINSDITLKNVLGEDFGFIQGYDGKFEQLSKFGSIIKTAFKMGDNLDGSFYQGIRAIKLQRILEYALIFPERRFIWIGDNGQADEIVGKELLDKHPTTFIVCIHVVKPVENPDPRIHYFYSYTELAEILHRLEIFTRKAVNAVIEGVRKYCYDPKYPKRGSYQYGPHCLLPTAGATAAFGGRSRSRSNPYRTRKLRRGRVGRTQRIRNSSKTRKSTRTNHKKTKHRA